MPPGPPGPPWPAVRPTNTKAILAVALLSFPVASIILGVLARQEIKRTGENGYALATTGMVVGIVLVSFFLVGVVVYVGVFATVMIGGGLLSSGHLYVP